MTRRDRPKCDRGGRAWNRVAPRFHPTYRGADTPAAIS